MDNPEGRSYVPGPGTARQLAYGTAEVGLSPANPPEPAGNAADAANAAGQARAEADPDARRFRRQHVRSRNKAGGPQHRQIL